MSVTMLTATFDRPGCLRHLVECFRVQTYPEWHLRVIAEGPTAVTGDLGTDRRVSVVRFPQRNGDWGNRARAAELRRVELGDWVGMTHDDNYYVPTYFEDMIRVAGDADFVYCNMLHNGTGYAPFTTAPKPNGIDLGGWLARRELILSVEFPNPDQADSDGQFAQALAAKARRVVKHEGFLFVHN